MVDDEKQKIRILFWGMTGEFSYLVLERLLQAAINICGVVIPSATASRDLAPITRLESEPSRSLLPMSQPYVLRSTTHLAWQEQIPVFELQQLGSPLVGKQLAALQADVAVVACFPWRIPEDILAIPRHGFLNLHPSLLPELRGPYPLFWTFRLDQQQTGVTVHQMDSGLDSGAIVLQQKITLAEGISGPVANRLLATQGASLLVNAIHHLAAGKLRLNTQAEGGSSYSRPTVEDFHIPISWSARRAFNFVRGTAEWNIPFRVVGPDFDVTIRQALSFDENARQENPLLRDGRDCWIQFTPGVLHAR